jgi:GT2 family glycosyltransferase
MSGQGQDMGAIAVVIVNYGTADLSIAAVESVMSRHHGGRTVSVHLVDNASPGDDASVLARAHGERGWGARVTLYPEHVNHGFGRGNNVVFRALRQAGSPPAAVFLLNPDARLENEAIDCLASFLEAHPKAACAGARIAKPDGTAVTAAFRFPTAASEFSDTLSFGPVARLLARSSVPLTPDLPTALVDWVAGAAVLIRWTALEQVGGFDPDFFLYFEEVDLMHRLSRQGWETWHVAEARVIHAEGAATGVRSDDTRREPLPDYWYDSWYQYFTKNHGTGFARLAALARAAGWSMNRVLSALRRRPANAPPRWVDGFSRRVVWPLAGRPARGQTCVEP